MFYPELQQKIATGEIMENDLVWVMGYHRLRPLEKSTRHVPPTLVQIRSNREVPLNRNVLTSGYHFRPCGPSGKVLSKIILPYASGDNLYSSSKDYGSLSFFFTEDEAREAYAAAAEVVREQITEAQKRAEDEFLAMLSEVDERIAKNL